MERPKAPSRAVCAVVAYVTPPDGLCVDDEHAESGEDVTQEHTHKGPVPYGLWPFHTRSIGLSQTYSISEKPYGTGPFGARVPGPVPFHY